MEDASPTIFAIQCIRGVDLAGGMVVKYELRIVRFICVVGFSVLMVLLGCPASFPTDSGVEASPSGAELFALITETDPFEDWTQFPEAKDFVASAAPHGPMARIWINQEVENALAGVSGGLPNGSIIVKENLGESTSEKADAWTVMWKVSGFDPDNNDWFWANVTPDGVVNAEGKIDGCIACHAGVRDNDFVFLHQFSGN